MRTFLHFSLTFFAAFYVAAHPGNHDAMRRVDKSLEATPNSPELLLERAFLYFSAGHFLDAQRDIDEIRSSDANFSGLDPLQAKLFMGRGEYAAAERLFVSLLLKDPEDKGLLFSYSEALVAQQKWGAAEKAVEQWLHAKGETRPEEALSLLMDFRRSGRERALAAYNLLDKTIENIGKVPVLYHIKADWFEEDGQLMEALVLIEDLQRRFPANLDYAYRRAELLERLGRESEAHKIYKTAMLQYESLPASRRNAPARLQAMAKLRMAFERTKHDEQ